jgi:hypothetical protein
MKPRLLCAAFFLACSIVGYAGDHFVLNLGVAHDNSGNIVELSATKNSDGTYSLATIGSGTTYIVLNTGIAHDPSGQLVRLSANRNNDGTYSIATTGGGGGGGAPTGPAGGVLGGTYPNPTFGTFTSATLETAISDETGSGAAVFATSPNLVTPNIAGFGSITGVIPIANLATGTPTGSKFIRDDGTLAVPAGLSFSGGTVGDIVTAASATTIQDSGTLLSSLAPLASPTFTGTVTAPNVTISGGALVLSGNQSAPAWTTNGLRIQAVAGTLTDTTSSGTVAAAYTNKLGGNTIAASSATTFTEYASLKLAAPVAGTNVTITNPYALDVDSVRLGTAVVITPPVTLFNAVGVTLPSMTGLDFSPGGAGVVMGSNNGLNNDLWIWNGGGNTSELHFVAHGGTLASPTNVMGGAGGYLDTLQWVGGAINALRAFTNIEMGTRQGNPSSENDVVGRIQLNSQSAGRIVDDTATVVNNGPAGGVGGLGVVGGISTSSPAYVGWAALTNGWNLRLYRIGYSFTANPDEPTNYERAVEGWTTSSTASGTTYTIRTEAGGTGLARPISILPGAPPQVAASTAGVAVGMTASNATAGSSSAGAAAGGDVNITSGNAARFTSGNANGGNINLVPGSGIGSGSQGVIQIGTSYISVNNSPTNYGFGFGIASSAAFDILANTTLPTFRVKNDRCVIGVNNVFGFSNSVDAQQTMDTGMSRLAAHSFAFGNGTASDVTGILNFTTAVQSGKTTTYNGIATAGTGFPLIVAAARVTAQSAANASIATYTTPASDGSYEVSMNMNVTAATAISTSMNCTYTDESNTSRTMIFPTTSLSGSFLAGGLVTGTGAFETPVMHIRCKASTSITLSTATGTFSSAVYTAEGIIKQMQ